MHYFRRSLRYLWPYRARLIVATICVIVIAMLWSGGIGLVLPGAKILLTDDGLHGWAHSELSNDHLGADLIEQEPQGQLEDPDIDRVLSIKRLSDDGPADKAGIRRNNWIVGIDGKTMSARNMLRQIAKTPPGQQIQLRLKLRHGYKNATVTMGKESSLSRVLKLVVQHVPEPANKKDSFKIFLGLLAVVLIITLVRGIFTFIQEYLMGSAIWLGIMDLRCENYDKVLHLPTTYFSTNVSDATSRFVSDINDLARGQNTLLGKTMVEPAKAIGCLVLALLLSWQLTLMAMLTGPIAFWLIRRFGKKMHKAARKSLESLSNMLTVLGETLRGIRVVKAYTMENAERKRFLRVNSQLLKQQIKKERLDALTGPTVEALGMVAGIAAAGVAGYMVFNDYMKPENFFTWMAMLFAMFDPVRKLAKVTMRFSESDSAAKRIFELQDLAEEPVVKGATMLPRHSRSIEFQNVCFRYAGATADALRNVNLKVQAGQSVAVVGPNGSGKTTLLSLLPRLIDPTSGQVFIDGQDISKVGLRSLRRQIGLVTQDAVIFHATLFENVSYGLRRPKPEQVLAAAKQAFVDEFAVTMPEGYQTLVGEQGATLSGGQKQRISIARAILRDPAIMIFDEAMSQVDSDSERRIHQAMEQFVKGRTTFTIAHRFATVLSADVIVVMADGTVIDCGTHEQLLGRCKLYAHLYRTQFTDSGGLDVTVATETAPAPK